MNILLIKLLNCINNTKKLRSITRLLIRNIILRYWLTIKMKRIKKELMIARRIPPQTRHLQRLHLRRVPNHWYVRASDLFLCQTAVVLSFSQRILVFTLLYFTLCLPYNYSSSVISASLRYITYLTLVYLTITLP